MTAIELFFSLCRIAVSLVSGVALWNAHPVFGVAGALIALLLFPYAVSALCNCLGDRPLDKPTCTSDRCDNEDYIWTRTSDGKLVCQCKCGHEYVMDGKRFLTVDSNDTIKPYKRWSEQDGWILEDDR
jgi:hypothetical protein